MKISRNMAIVLGMIVLIIAAVAIPALVADQVPAGATCGMGGCSVAGSCGTVPPLPTKPACPMVKGTITAIDSATGVISIKVDPTLDIVKNAKVGDAACVMVGCKCGCANGQDCTKCTCPNCPMKDSKRPCGGGKCGITPAK